MRTLVLDLSTDQTVCAARAENYEDEFRQFFRAFGSTFEREPYRQTAVPLTPGRG